MLVSPLLGNAIGGPAGDFVIAEWTEPGCPSDGPIPIAPLHLHRQCDEAWYVIEGTLCIQVNGQELTVPAGGCAYVPKGTPHTYWNPEPEPVRYLIFMTVTTYHLIEAIHTMPDRSLERVRQLFEAHDAELL